MNAQNRLVGVNERGLRVGEDHQNAVLSDAQVELIRQLHDRGVSYRALAKLFRVSKSVVAKIVRFERRASFPVRWKRVHVPGSGH